MPVLSINFGDSPSGDGWAKGKKIDHHVTETATIGGLAGGMVGGKPSVGIHFMLPNGEGVLFETSLALFLTAADALRARFGDPRE